MNKQQKTVYVSKKSYHMHIALFVLILICILNFLGIKGFGELKEALKDIPNYAQKVINQNKTIQSE
jgi:glucosamine 6-phosphate synthetase-like amidotransferase/phosphosugar isomerase protein